jgi:hypothetical protein
VHPRPLRHLPGPAQAQAAEDRGAAISLATAAEYALLLTTTDSPHPVSREGRLRPARQHPARRGTDAACRPLSGLFRSTAARCAA